MGCFSLRALFGRKKSNDATEQKTDYGSRPGQHSLASTETAFSAEKPAAARYAPSTASYTPSGVAGIRPTANPAHSAYSGPARRHDQIYGDGYESEKSKTYARYNGNPQPRESDKWTGSFASTQVSDASRLDAKGKEDDIDDPIERERRRKADQARRKAEQEEQERLDFFQMM